MATAAQNPKERTCPYLPEELWEHIFKIVTSLDHLTRFSEVLSPSLSLTPLHPVSNNGDNCTLKTLSVVSKQFLSITNRLRFSLRITDKTIPFLQLIYQRFPNLTFLHITLSSRDTGDLNALLTEISTYPLHLNSLIISDPYQVPTNGLFAFSKNMKNLTSLTCSRINRINMNDLFFIADCFPLLEELILTTRGCRRFSRLLACDNDQFLALPKLRKIALCCHFISGRRSIKDLCKNCDLLQEVKVINCRPPHQETIDRLRQHQRMIGHLPRYERMIGRRARYEAGIGRRPPHAYR